MRTTWRCPHCKEETHSLEKMEVYDDEGELKTKVSNRKLVWPITDANGKMIVKNLFHFDLITLLFIASIILLLLGFKQVNSQCFEIVHNPCEYYSANQCFDYAANPEKINLSKEVYINLQAQPITPRTIAADNQQGKE